MAPDQYNQNLRWGYQVRDFPVPMVSTTNSISIAPVSCIPRIPDCTEFLGLFVVFSWRTPLLVPVSGNARIEEYCDNSLDRIRMAQKKHLIGKYL
jgi:hypothetical protein